MHHGDNENVICFDRVQDAIWKNSGKATAHVFVNDTPSIGRVDDASDSSFDRLDKPTGQLWIAFSVAVTGFLILF
jgi:hypothetical protein